MKKLFIVVLAAIGMVSCMNTDEVIEVSNGDAIAFADAFIENSVRATAYDNNTLDHFNVWGTVTANGSTAPIFAGTEVTKANGVWSYTDATQYWVKGVTYNFRALVDGTTPVVEDNMLTGVNVNITEQEDVLVAEDLNVTYTGGEQYVAFQFAHILSKVKFTFDTTIANTAYTYTISNVKIEDNAEAAYDIERKIWSGHKGEATITFAQLTDEMFLIPSAEKKTISFDVTLKLGDVVLSNETKTVTTDIELEAGHAYNFTVALGEPGEPIKFTATVEDWDPAGDIDLPFYDANTNTATVNSANGLQIIAEGIADGTYGEDINIVLGADIDLNANTNRSIVSNWKPIGTEDDPFAGTFDGKGHTIKNLALVETEAKEGKAFIGFFGYAEDATIKNVTFENVYINIPCLDIDHSQGHIGAVAGSLEGESTIENVTVKGDIKVEATQSANGASRVAVVAGGNSYGDVTMKNVHVIANEGSYLKANNNVGALAGQLQGKNVFENCSSNIDVTGTKFFAGGIIGLAAGDSTFTNCETTGDVTITAGREGRNHDQYRVGGIAGGWADGATNVCTLVDCSYTGTISGTNADGSVAEPLDYMGYVGRGYTLNGCQGSKVVIDGIEFVQKYNTAAQAGIYTINGCTPVSTADELVAALEANEGVYLLNDIKIDPAAMSNAYGTTGINVKNGQTIDGGGHTLNIRGAGGTWDSGINTTGGLIKNITVTGSFRGIFINHNSTYSEKVVLENVTLTGVTYTISCDQGLYQGIEATNCTFNGWTSYAATIGDVKFVGCSFGEGSGYAFCRPYAPTKFVDCAFEAGFKLDARATVTFQNCTIGGVALTAENLSTLVTSGSIANTAVVISTVAELVEALAKEGEGDVNLANAIEIEGKEVTLDLNGKEITSATTDAFIVNDGATLTISGNGTVKSNGAPIRAIGGKVIVEGGTFTQTGAWNTATSTYRYCVDSREGGEVIIKGGTFNTNNGLISVSAGSSLVIDGGEFTFENNTGGTRHFAYVSGDLTINDGVFRGVADSGAGGCFFCGAASTCNIQVNGGKFTSLWMSGSVNSIFESYATGSSINVTGGLFNTDGGITNFVVANTDDATKAQYPYVAK